MDKDTASRLKDTQRLRAVRLPQPTMEPTPPPPKEVLGPHGVPAHWKNVATDLRRLNRNEEISIHVDGTGYARKKTPCEGFEVTLADGSTHFIPAALLLGAR